MKEKRDTNRDRLNRGLDENKDPRPEKRVSQGSYIMRTMVQHDDNTYDIDDGALFIDADLKNKDGSKKTARQAKQMVLDALMRDTKQFKTDPEIRDNCVRIYYEVGYHVDIPVYRKDAAQTHTRYELASKDWKESDPEGVTKWFDERLGLRRMLGDENNQMRRMVRYLKKYAMSRPSWDMPSGFILTILTDEKYPVTPDSRDDRALYNLFDTIKQRLDADLVVMHPVITTDKVSKDDNDKQMKFCREKFQWAKDTLQPCFDTTKTKDDALTAWGKVFDTVFFDQFKSGGKTEKKYAGIATLTPGKPVDKGGSGESA